MWEIVEGENKNPKEVDTGNKNSKPLTFKVTITLIGHTDAPCLASWGFQDRLLLTASNDGTVRLWVPLGDEELQLSKNNLDTDSESRLIALEKELGIIHHSNHNVSSESSNVVGSPSIKRSIRVQSEECLVVYKKHTGAISAITWIDDRHFASAGCDKMVFLWSVRDGPPLWSLLFSHKVQDLVMNYDRSMLLGVDEGKCLRIIHLNTFQSESMNQTESRSSGNSNSEGVEQKIIVQRGPPEIVSVLCENGLLRNRWEKRMGGRGNTGTTSDVGGQVAGKSTNKPNDSDEDMEGGSSGGRNNVTSSSLNPYENSNVNNTRDSKDSNHSTSSSQSKDPTNPTGIKRPAFASTYIQPGPGYPCVSSILERAPITAVIPSSYCNQFLFSLSNDGNHAEGSVRLYDLEDVGRNSYRVMEMATIKYHNSLAMNNDENSKNEGGGSTSGDSKVKSFDFGTGYKPNVNRNEGVIRVYKGHAQSRFVLRPSFLGDREQFVACGSEDSRIYIWHRHTGGLLRILSGHSGAVNSVMGFGLGSGRSSWLCSASDDATVRVWIPNGVFTNAGTNQRGSGGRLVGVSDFIGGKESLFFRMI